MKKLVVVAMAFVALCMTACTGKCNSNACGNDSIDTVMVDTCDTTVIMPDTVCAL